MSAPQQTAIRALYEQLIITIVLFLGPVIVSWVINIVAVAIWPNAPAADYAGIGYGIQCIAGAGSSGTCVLFYTSASATGGYFSFPTILEAAIDSVLIIVFNLFGLWELIKLAPKMVESRRQE